MRERRNKDNIVPRREGNIDPRSLEQKERNDAMPSETDEEDAYRPKLVYRKIFFKECPVAGLMFHVEKDDDLWFELEEGAELALIRHRGNPHDSNAVAVALADDYDGNPDDFDFDFILGYIPRSENAEIAAMMDAGYAGKFSAKITTLQQYGSYDNRIRITIYLESREPIVQRPDLLRAEWLDRESYTRMVSEFKTLGFATFRWGSFMPDEQALPQAGDKIVVLHEVDNGIMLHLLHVLLIGEDCLKLGIDPTAMPTNDNCVHFILTNIAGPLVAPRNELGFLKCESLKEYSVQSYLSSKESEALKRMFGIEHAIKIIE